VQLFNATNQLCHLRALLQNINAHFENRATGHTERLTLLLCQPLILHCGAVVLAVVYCAVIGAVIISHR
jgi:hypothetical protein